MHSCPPAPPSLCAPPYPAALRDPLLQAGLARRTAPPYRLTYEPTAPPAPGAAAPPPRHRVAVLREEGSNGDREMSAAFVMAGFEVWDVTMSDLVAGRADLGGFRGLVFPGGFSYADVLDSAKGWAGTVLFNPAVLAQVRPAVEGGERRSPCADLWRVVRPPTHTAPSTPHSPPPPPPQFSAFYARPDTFSLGICNGCQLMALLGWVPFGPGGSHGGVAVRPETQPRFVHNRSGRYESRFPTVRIAESPAVLLRGMAGSALGVWTQHGEGQAYFPDGAVLEGERWGGRCHRLPLPPPAGPALSGRPHTRSLSSPPPPPLSRRGGRPRPPALRRRRGRADRGVPTQPQRLHARHRGPLLARRATPGHDAAPGAAPLGEREGAERDAGRLERRAFSSLSPLLVLLLLQTWNWPWMPAEWRGLEASPWLRMFQNARAWADEVAPPPAK